MKPFFRWTGIIVLAGLIVQACGHKAADAEFEKVMGERVVIPYDKLDKRACSMFCDTTLSDRRLKVVHYLVEEGCTACGIKKMAYWEKTNASREGFDDVERIYIAATTSQLVETVYAQFCKSRIEGSVYLDTCNAFLKANPHIPDNTLFHTFVLNDLDSVVMVGDPFKNEKMEALFLKILDREKQRKKAV